MCMHFKYMIAVCWLTKMGEIDYKVALFLFQITHNCKVVAGYDWSIVFQFLKMRKISLVTHYQVSSKAASLPEGITMSFVPFENFLIHVELSHCSDLLQKHEPSLELQNDEPFGNSVLQSWPGFLWKVLYYPGVCKFLCELTFTNCSLFWGNSYWKVPTNNGKAKSRRRLGHATNQQLSYVSRRHSEN